MFIQLAGHQVYCDTADKPLHAELPTLLFIHGAQNDHSVWEQLSPYFAEHGYNVLAVDLPGHSSSGGAALTTIEAMGAWLVALLDKVGVEQTSLIGHSMGSLVAMEAARCNPERFTRLALLGSAYPMKVADSLLTMAREDEAVAIKLVSSWSHLQDPQHSPQPGIDLEGNAQRLMQRLSVINPAQLLFTDLTACNQYCLGEQAATAIAQQGCGVLFLLGQQDRMTPLKASANLRAALPQAQLQIIPDCGHAMMSEQPEAVLSALTHFLQQ